MRHPYRFLTDLAALAAALPLLAACGVAPEQAILGAWRDERSADTLEFLTDGTVIATTLHPRPFGPPVPVPMSLRYAFPDDRHLKLTARAFGFESAQVWEIVSITRNRLELKNADARDTFTRVR